MGDAPAYRLWPPVALGLPLLVGVLVTALAGDPLPHAVALRVVGLVLIVAFAGWNGVALGLMARFRTGLLPGMPTATILDRGPFGLSRNPLYVGLVVLYAGLALLVPSLWALLLLPVGVALVEWGAIRPEERYLRAKFGADYEAYAARVRRWL